MGEPTCVYRLGALGLGLTLALAVACGGRAEPAGGGPAPDVTTTATDAGPVYEPPTDPRPRSVPPPGPPAPPGVMVIAKDVIALALSVDGQLLAGGDLAGRALLWDLGRRAFVVGKPTPDGVRVRPVVFAPRGGSFLAGAFDRPDQPWRLYDGDDGRLPRLTFGDPGATAVAAAFAAPTGDAVLAVTASEGPSEVAVRELPSGRVVWREAAHAEAVAIASSGAVVALVDGPRARVVAVPDGVERLAVTEAVPLERAALDEAMFAASEGAKVVTWGLDGAPRAVVALRDESRPIRDLRRVVFGGAGPERLVAVTRPEADGLVLWTAADGAPLVEVPMGCACETHALSGDGCVAACACRGREEIRWSRISLAACAGAPARAPDP